MMKKVTTGVLALLLALSLCACGETGEAGQSVEEIMAKAQENMAKVQSMSYDMTMDMDMSVAQQALTTHMTMQADYILAPMQMKMDMTMDMGELGAMDMTMYMETEGSDYAMYTGMDAGDGTMTWSKTVMEDMSALEQYDASASMSLYLSCAKDFTKGETEDVHGAASTRYDGVISNENLNRVMEESGVMEQYAQMGLDQEQMATLLTDMGDLPVSIWIADESCIPVKYEMDMSAIMQGLMDKLAADEESGEAVELEVSRVFIALEMYNINGVESVEIPQEALDSAA